MIKNPRLWFWILMPLLILGLNVRRDLSRAIAKYDWELVEKKMLHRAVSSPGVMEAQRVAEMKSQVEEEVEKRFVDEGQSVKKGDLLFQLTRTKTQLEYEQQRNSHLNAEADLRKATREVSIQRKLLKNMAVSRSQVEDAEQALERAKAAFDISSRQMEIIKKKLDSTLVKAPLSGVVLKLNVTPGQQLSPGTEIVTVGDISSFSVRTKVDELDIQQVSVGQQVEILADAFAGRPMKGKVRAIATQAEREAFAKIEVMIDINNSEKLPLKHNLSVRVNIFTQDIADALSVAVGAIIKKSGDNAWVMVRGKWGFAGIRKVVLGKTAGDRVEILSGIKVGEKVGTEKLSTEKPL